MYLDEAEIMSKWNPNDQAITKDNYNKILWIFIANFLSLFLLIKLFTCIFQPFANLSARRL